MPAFRLSPKFPSILLPVSSILLLAGLLLACPAPEDPNEGPFPEQGFDGMDATSEPGPHPVGHQLWTFDDPIASGGPLVFLVDEIAAEGIDRHRVLLPVRPNGTFGWVAESDVTLERHNYAILVELSAFQLTLFDHDQIAFTTVVGVARDNAPTPNGIYYTTELLRPPVPDSVYGTYAYGLSGFSETFEQFAGGPGQLGIHGTNDPDTIGTQVSSGCIRMHNDDISHLVETIGLPVAVPVEVRV